MYKFTMKKKAEKQFMALSEPLQKSFALFFAGLVHDPFQNKLSEDLYHAHVKYKWVAVWEVDKSTKTITVIYVGSREDAPY